MANPLDNPVWYALTSRHAALARRNGNAARYPADVAPFAGACAFDSAAATQLAGIVEPGETVLFVGPQPAFDVRWRVEQLEHIAQGVCESRLAIPDGPRVIELDATHTADVLELTVRVYPHYFRRRTVEMGRYFGIYDGVKLASNSAQSAPIRRIWAVVMRGVSSHCWSTTSMIAGICRSCTSATATRAQRRCTSTWGSAGAAILLWWRRNGSIRVNHEHFVIPAYAGMTCCPERRGAFSRLAFKQRIAT
jgi:hypothetical protein